MTKAEENSAPEILAAEAADSGDEAADLTEEDHEEISGLEKCTRQSAQTAAKTVKYPSSQQKENQSTVETATRKRKDSNPKFF